MNAEHGWRLGRRPALDGLRGVAILLVLMSHVVAIGTPDPDRWHPMGTAGVTLFFVLSGFLITSLLIGEQRDTGRVSLSAFYLRRARRLLPALAGVLLLFGLPALAVGATNPKALLAIAFYCSNVVPLHGMLFFGQMWSLAIEEQFYVVWPVLFCLLMRRSLRTGKIVTTVTVAALVAWDLLLPSLTRHPYGRTDFHSVSLLAGCALAFWAADGLPELRRRLVAVPTVGGLCAFALVGGWTAHLDATVVLAATGLGVVAVWAACQPLSILGHPILRYLGRRSYGLYLWHYPVMWALLGSGNTTDGRRLLSLAVSFGLAEASWRLLEARFVHRRRVDGGVDRYLVTQVTPA